MSSSPDNVAGQMEQSLRRPGALLLLIQLGVLALSFSWAETEGERPLLLTLALLGTGTAIWGIALLGVLRNPESGRQHLTTILGFAVAYRVILLPSWPIQEIDFYRYLWDGQATWNGINPYRWSPYQVEQAWGPGCNPPPADLAELHGIAYHSGPAGKSIFEQVHYRDVPTAYPPAAQAIFTSAAALTESDAPLWKHILVWKCLLLYFDIGTLLLLVVLLDLVKLPASWCLGYAWCPLVLKEFANSGHFDAIAGFFTVAAVVFLVGASRRLRADSGPARSPLVALGMLVLAMAFLALGVLTKSYPVVLLPTGIAWLIAHLRWKAVIPVAGFAAVLLLGYLPFTLQGEPGDLPSAVQPVVPVPAGELPESQPHHPGAGLGRFLSEWEINDLLFMLVRENLRRPQDTAPWFVLVPGSWREAVHDCLLLPLAGSLSAKADLALLATQAVMGTLLLILGLWWAWSVYRNPWPPVFLRAVFLTLAWSWLLAAAQNPWYLIWCLPFMIFAGRLSWFLLPALALIYYMRFWFEAIDPSGRLFDYGIVWLEYLPFFLVLAIESCWQAGWFARPMDRLFRLLNHDRLQTSAVHAQ